MSRTKKAAGPARGAPIEIPWPLTITGLYTAWCDLVAPVQVHLAGLRTDRQPVPAKSLSIAGGVAESKKQKIEESGLLESANAPTDDDAEASPVDSSATALAAAILEATTKAGVTRPCDGHPETVQRKGERIPVICFNCHAPSLWPGSPEQMKDDVKDMQIKEWMRSAMECIVLMLEELDRGKTSNVMQWSQSAGIGTDKIIEGTKRRIASRDYARRVIHQFVRLAYLIRHEPLETIAGWLTAGGLPEAQHVPAVIALATVTPREPVAAEGTLAALGATLPAARKVAA